MSTDTSHQFDAIVIGAGMTGGWAAKELCEKGLKTLLLERGRNVEHLKDYPTTNMQPWEFPHRGQVPYAIRKENPVISKCYAYKEDAMQALCMIEVDRTSGLRGRMCMGPGSWARDFRSHGPPLDAPVPPHELTSEHAVLVHGHVSAFFH